MFANGHADRGPDRPAVRCHLRQSGDAAFGGAGGPCNRGIAYLRRQPVQAIGAISVAYAREHREIFSPILHLFATMREIGAAIAYEVGAFG